MAARATGQATTMRAVVRKRYGSLDGLRLEEVEKPELADDGVLVRVRATSINRGDYYIATGTPLIARGMMGFFRPRDPMIGGDFAGVVEAVGKDVADLEPGDDVFGGRSGAFAEYVMARMGFARMPANLTYEEAAAVPVAAITALQAFRDHGKLQPGQRVLINGASGGVGTFAIQMAKALGASEVTAVCSTRNVEQARALGADHVIDYTREDFTRSGKRYDLMFDNAGTKSLRACKRVLEPDARIVLVGGKAGRVAGPLVHVAAMKLAAVGGRRKVAFFIAKFNRPDMAFIRDLVESGQLRPVVEKRYELSEIADALRLMGDGHARGKIVVTV